MTSLPEQDTFQIVKGLCFNSNKLTDRERDALKVVYQTAIQVDGLLDDINRLEQRLIHNGLAEDV